jgi:hypothetical protein
MKRAKLMLAAIALFAVVGGAYAVKANRASTRIYVSTTVGGAFSVTKTGFTFAEIGLPVTGFAYSTSTTLTTVPLTTYYVGN